MYNYLSNIQENIFDDFSCSYKLKPGKLYVCENHLCFYTDFLVETKLVFTFKEIDSITLKKGGNIEIKKGTQFYSFSGFEQADLAYQFMRASWSQCCPEKDNGEILSDEQPNKEQPQSLLQEEVKSVDMNIAPMSESRTLSDDKQKIQDSLPGSAHPIKPIFVPLNDSEALEKSYTKFPKREKEFMRYIFSFSPEEYYKRFIAPDAPFNDIKLYEAIGSKDFDDKGWEQVEGSPDKKKRLLNFQYKLSGSFFMSFAYSIKDSVLTMSE